MLQVLKHQQGSPEWKAHRFTHRNSSEAPVVMGAGRISRDKLLHLKATQTEQEFSDYVREVILESGHSAEAAQRPLIEDEFGVELSPITLHDDIWSVSFDGIDFDYETSWEHKVYNKELFELVSSGGEPADHIWQIEHGFIAVPTLKKCIFTVSDGTSENKVSIIVKPSKKRQKQLIAAWELFDKDLDALKQKLASEPAPEQKAELVVTVSVSLPVLTHEVRGTLVLHNLDVYKEKALALVERSKSPLKTDQDFVDATELVKAFEDAEKKLAAKREQVIADFAALNQYTTDLSELQESFRQARLAFSKQIEAEKTRRKNELIEAGCAKVRDYIKAKLSLFAGEVSSLCPELNVPRPHFEAAIKGKSSVEKIEEAINQTATNLILKVNEQADLIADNLATFKEKAAGFNSLFPDLQSILTKQPDDFLAMVEARIAKAQAELEAKRKQEAEAAEKARLEKENLAKIPTQAAAIPVQKPALLPVTPPEKAAGFENESADAAMLQHTAQFLKELQWPDMKTARGQDIASKAKAQIMLVAEKIISASKTI